MMRTRRWVAGAAAVGFLLAAADASTAGDAARGKELFAEKCIVCHGATGKGDGPAAATLNPPPADLADRAIWKEATDATIAATIEKGHRDMPPMDQNQRDVQDLIAYLKRTFAK